MEIIAFIIIILILILAIGILIMHNLSLNKKITEYNNTNQKINNLNVLQDFINTIGEEDTVEQKINKINNILIERYEIKYSTIVLYDGAEYTIKASNVDQKHWDTLKSLHNEEIFKESIKRGSSKYITVEVNDSTAARMSVPAGFLGYPVRDYNGTLPACNAVENMDNIKPQKPFLQYNTNIYDEIRPKKQYFGMSDLVGIDEDILSYKGVEAYNDDPDYLTPCFHLDARILNGKPEPVQENGVYYVTDGTNKQVVDVDGTTGYTWSTVSMAETTDAGIEPRIGTDDVMEGTIYEDKAYRKFTVCFYGGWDGWDYYRTSRSNGDDFRVNKYKGSINKVSGDGSMFSYMKDADLYGFDSDTKIINSDYYAYLAGVKQLDNPKTVVLNLFATPGIDYVNNADKFFTLFSLIDIDGDDIPELFSATEASKPVFGTRICFMDGDTIKEEGMGASLYYAEGQGLLLTSTTMSGSQMVEVETFSDGKVTAIHSGTRNMKDECKWDDKDLSLDEYNSTIKDYTDNMIQPKTVGKSEIISMIEAY